MRFDVDESTTTLSELLEWAGMRPGRGAAKRRMWIADTSMTLCRISRQHSPARPDAVSARNPYLDPFDRMLGAQAMEESCVILSRDPHLGVYDVDVVRA
ncbi:MAG: type II toxin-antitoxin system VapC family toxin [Actinomycetales bacterium]|nr:type II toxin-antitoxin system VapC family toxin [Actinomycetales bacterium]MCP4893630.1 type II toxin-antitoxin system VapC family toxin [Actinomycetales bacterium]